MLLIFLILGKGYQVTLNEIIGNTGVESEMKTIPVSIHFGGTKMALPCNPTCFFLWHCFVYLQHATIPQGLSFLCVFSIMMLIP